MVTHSCRLTLILVAAGLVAGCLDSGSSSSGSSGSIRDLDTAREPADLGSPSSTRQAVTGVQEIALSAADQGMEPPASPTPDSNGRTMALAGMTEVARSPLVAESSITEMCEGGGSASTSPSLENWDGTGEMTMTFNNCSTFFGVWDGRVWFNITEDASGVVMEMEYGEGSTPFSMSLEFDSDSMMMSFLGNMLFEDPALNAPGSFPGSSPMHFAANWEIDWDFNIQGGPSGWLVAFQEDFEVYDDFNYLDVSGRFGIQSSGLECGIGAVTVTTTETLQQGFGGELIAGVLEFSNDAGQTATASYNADGTVTISAGGETETVPQSELASACEVEIMM